MHVVIDARLYGPLGKGLGRYIERLIENLEVIDAENRYSVLLSRENFHLFTPRNDRWTKICVPVRWYTLREQFVIPWVLWRLKPDLVHFPHFNVPLLVSCLSPTRGSTSESRCRSISEVEPRKMGNARESSTSESQIRSMFNFRKFKIRIPYVVTIHDLILLKHPSTRTSTLRASFYWFKYLGYRLILRYAIRHATHIITVSNTVRNEILTKFNNQKRFNLGIPLPKDYEVEPLKINALRITTTYEASDGVEIGQLKMPDANWLMTRGITKPYLLYVGNAYPHKNLDFLIDWFVGDLKSQISNYQLVLVGTEDYFYKKLKEKVSQFLTFPVSQAIIFFGYATESELADLYRHASLVVYPSLEEGFGLPPLEAMRYDVPVVVSDLPVLHEILGDAATYFNPKSKPSLTKAIESLQEIEPQREVQPQNSVSEVELQKINNQYSTSAHERSESLRSKKISLGRLQVSKYSWRRMAEETLAIYNNREVELPFTRKFNLRKS